MDTATALSPSSIKSIRYGKSQNPKLLTIKMICDGLGITLGEFFSTPEFDALEQEIQQHTKKPRRVCALWRKESLNLFSAGACTWPKILLRLPVCELCAIGAQRVRAADCKRIVEKPHRGFSTV